ncbi:MAG: MBL fold metallo-hydrolase [Spirochaetales bacterium]|uniref:MBL fold metallo-hydrolase n=1 Tax=Candidatus Thalassospirochaeta sargassi TaxID=3119039 RepID=A0AAJ1IIS6_9SPIO|nr:MBL fold metallo-hydrolase [Spirochaetales bacterium]
MLVTVLGSGTSFGVPSINCDCPVCTSDDPHDKRTRTSVWIQTENTSVIIDTSTDFRAQALREKIPSLDALFFTHCHADHIHGIDDIRPFTFHKTIPVYGNEVTIKEFRNRFSYIFMDTQKGGGKPRISLNPISDKDTAERRTINIGDVELLPVPIKHGKLDVLGYRINNFAYLTDCNLIPESSYEKLDGVEYLVIDALRYQPHPTHFTIPEAIEASRRIGAGKTWLTHLCHDVGHEDLKQELPDGIAPAFDGLKIEI